MINTSLIFRLFIILIPIFVDGYWHVSHNIKNESPVTDLALDSDSKSFSSAANARSLKFSALGRNFHLTLTPADIFAPNFKDFSSSNVNEHGETLFEEVTHSAPLPGSFHSIKDGGYGTLYLHHDANNRLQVEGIVDDDMRLIVEANQLDSQSAINHKMVQLSWKQINGDPLTYDQVSEPTDGIREQNLKRSGETIKKQRRVGTSNKVTVEVLVILDQAVLTALNSSSEDVRKYLGIYWNSVQRRYDETSDPNVRFALVGVYKADAKMIKNCTYKPGHLNGHKLLVDLTEWLYKKQKQFPKFDLAMLLTNLDIASDIKGEMHPNLLGRAYVGAVCNEDVHGRRLYKCGVSEDVAPVYSGVLTTAHEIGHLLGSPHDGSATTKDCPAEEGYLMGIGQNTKRSWRFSPCSLNMMQTFLRSESANCVRDEPEPRTALIRMFPGQDIISLNDLCKKWYGDLYSMYQPKKVNCNILWCQNSASRVINTRGAPPEGTSCGKNMICVTGICSPKT